MSKSPRIPKESIKVAEKKSNRIPKNYFFPPSNIDKEKRKLEKNEKEPPKIAKIFWENEKEKKSLHASPIICIHESIKSENYAENLPSICKESLEIARNLK